MRALIDRAAAIAAKSAKLSQRGRRSVVLGVLAALVVLLFLTMSLEREEVQRLTGRLAEFQKYLSPSRTSMTTPTSSSSSDRHGSEVDLTEPFKSYPTKLSTAYSPRMIPGKVVIASMMNGQTYSGDAYLDVATEVRKRQEFADRNGMFYFHNTITDIHDDFGKLMWEKPKTIRAALAAYPEAEWVWWLDMDAMIMVHEIDMQSYLLSEPAFQRERINPDTDQEFIKSINEWFTNKPEARDGWRTEMMAKSYEETEWIIALDQNGFNAGSFLVRRRPAADTVLDLWVNEYFQKSGVDYGEQGLLERLMHNHTSVQSHTMVVRQDIINAYFWTWTPGKPICHIPGCWSICKLLWPVMEDARDLPLKDQPKELHGIDGARYREEMLRLRGQDWIDAHPRLFMSDEEKEAERKQREEEEAARKQGEEEEAAKNQKEEEEAAPPRFA